MDKSQVTQLLEIWRDGDNGAFDRLLPLVYNNLRQVASSYLRQERDGHTLQPTALVHVALEELSVSHPRSAKLVELRFFGGFSADEAAEILDLSRATLTRDWRFAQLWFYRRLDSTELSIRSKRIE